MRVRGRRYRRNENSPTPFDGAQGRLSRNWSEKWAPRARPGPTRTPVMELTGKGTSSTRAAQASRRFAASSLGFASLHQNRLILLVHTLEVRNLIIPFEMPNPPRHFVHKVFIMRA